jgi:predicted CDP-diglyceride synthetase/phosphatidate cytidylyltransferase
MLSRDVNYLAVIAAAIANVAIGTAWYNAPFAFNRIWLKSIGKSAEQVAQEFSVLKPLGALVGSLITAFLLAVFVSWTGAQTLLQGAFVGLLAAVGFAAITRAASKISSRGGLSGSGSSMRGTMW